MSSKSVPAGTRTLLILRHGKAEQDGPSDHERALAARGRTQSARVGRYLTFEDMVPSLVLVSSALRTRQTWEAVRAELPPGADANGPRVLVLDELYGGGPRDVLAAIAAHGEGHATVLVVGHEPTVSHTVDVLADDLSEHSALARVRGGVPTGALCILAVDDPWDELELGGQTLRAVVTD